MTPWTAARQASLSITNSQSLLKPMSIESVIPSNHLILCRPLLLPPSIFPSIRVFSNELVVHSRWPTYCSFSINPFNEHSELISFRMDWLHLLAVQGMLKSLLQQHIQHKFTVNPSWLPEDHGVSHHQDSESGTSRYRFGNTQGAWVPGNSTEVWLPTGDVAKQEPHEAFPEFTPTPVLTLPCFCAKTLVQGCI